MAHQDPSPTAAHADLARLLAKGQTWTVDDREGHPA